MPKPQKGEERADFISRCHRELRREGVTDSKHRSGKCFGIWRNFHGLPEPKRK